MPLPTFLMIIVGVIAAAGVSIALVQFAGLPVVWLSVGALAMALAVRGMRWH